MTATMVPIRSTRSRLPQPVFNSTVKRVRKRPGSPMAAPSPTRRSAFGILGLFSDTHNRRQQHIPQNKRELFTRQVFPVSAIPYEPRPPGGIDIDYAALAFAHYNPNLRVQYHAGLTPLLYEQASRIADRPSLGSSKIAESLISKYDRELNDMREIMMDAHSAVRQIDNEAAKWGEFDMQETLSRAVYLHIGLAVNSFCENSDNFKDLSRNVLWTGWQWGDFEGAPTEWIGQFRGKPRAVCHWKLDMTEADMHALVLAGKGYASAGHPLHPGFYASRVERNHLDCTDDRVTENAAKACALVS